MLMWPTTWITCTDPPYSYIYMNMTLLFISNFAVYKYIIYSCFKNQKNTSKNICNESWCQEPPLANVSSTVLMSQCTVTITWNWYDLYMCAAFLHCVLSLHTYIQMVRYPMSICNHVIGYVYNVHAITYTMPLHIYISHIHWRCNMLLELHAL